MTTTAGHPPTKILSSLEIDSTAAHDFLTSFIQSVDSHRHFSTSDLELADQRRIASALEGIYVPKAVEEVGGGEVEEEYAVMAEWNQGEHIEAEGGVGAETEEEAAQAIIVDKSQRKLDKKARKQEEKRARAEERARAKNEGS